MEEDSCLKNREVKSMKNKRTWNWKVIGGKNYKVVTKVKECVLEVYNEKDELVEKHDDITEEMMKILSKNFLDVVAREEDTIYRPESEADHYIR